MNSIKPKKSLGQNFLRDRNLIDKIINTLGLNPQDIVLEIGPGTGALTEHLLDAGVSLTAVEYDKRAVDFLKEKFPQNRFPFFRLLNADIRNINIADLFNTEISDGEKVKVIGNIPYNISSDIIFYLIENRDFLEKSQLMLQKEVALRLCAEPGSKTYGITTVAVNLTGRCRFFFDVLPASFYPSPKVTSAVIELMPDKDIDSNDYNEVMKLVKVLFNQRRKQLRNTLKNYLKPRIGNKTEVFMNFLDEKNPFFLNNRPEVLSYKNFIDLYKEIVFFKDNG